MFEKEILVASLRRERDVLKELVAELEAQNRYETFDRGYCDEVLRRIETTLRRLRRSGLTAAA